MLDSHNSLAHAPTMISLYSGAGGLDLGFAKAGFRPVFANDIDPFAVGTYNKLKNVQDVDWVSAAKKFEGHNAVAGDVRHVARDLRAGDADIVVGGPPCQGFSVAGRMDPDDPRSRHVFDFLGLVARVKPRAFVMENVAALARNRRWGEIVGKLKKVASSDYQTELVVLNASHYGVPQARERMFLIGVARGEAPFEVPAATTADSPPTVRTALGKFDEPGTAGNHEPCTAIITLAKRPILRRSPYAGMLFNGQGRPMNLDRPAPTLPASMGGNRTPIVDEDALRLDATPWIEGYHAALFDRGEDPLSTLPRDANLRRITVAEAAAIQTFPSDVDWQGTQSAKYRQIGNAVPPLLAFHVARAVSQSLGVGRTDKPVMAA